MDFHLRVNVHCRKSYRNDCDLLSGVLGSVLRGDCLMYRAFYNLEKMPFQISTDPAFLWLGEKHKEALATLKYGVLENKGFLLLTGDVGTGKTTLINALTSSLGDEVIVAKVPDPGMEKMDLMNYISHAFNMGKEFARKDAFLVHFSHFLNTAYAKGKKVLLIIDESQRFTQELLEEVRLLSNIEKNDAKLLNIFLVGQNEFNDVLLESGSRALRQRITLNYALDHLNMQETGQLVQHRLRVAGAKTEIFDPGALRAVYEFSKGFPRKINIICDHCMILGFVSSKKRITAQMVKECADEMRLPVSTYKLPGEQQRWVESAEVETETEDECVTGDIPVEYQDLPELPREVTPTGNGLTVMMIVTLFVVGLAYLTPGGREIVYQIRGYGKNIVSVADQYWSAASSGVTEVYPTAVTNKTLMEIPEGKVVKMAVREPVKVLPVKTDSPNVTTPAVVSAVDLQERFDDELEKNPPSSGTAEQDSEESFDAAVVDIKTVMHSSAEATPVISGKAEVLPVIAVVPDVVDDLAPLETPEPVEQPVSVEEVAAAVQEPPVAETLQQSQDVVVDTLEPGVEETSRQVSNLTELPDPRENPIENPVEEPEAPVVTPDEVVAQPAVVVEEMHDSATGTGRQSMDEVSEQSVRLLYDLEVAEYRDEIPQGLLPDSFADEEKSSEESEASSAPVTVSVSAEAELDTVEMEDATTPAEPIEIETTAVADAVELTSESPDLSVPEGVEGQDVQVLSAGRVVEPAKPEQVVKKDLSSLFSEMNSSLAAEDKVPDKPEPETLTKKDQFVEPIDQGKVIDWVLNKKSK
jgi:type II secretory pathway predicted ATPase ExeA